MGAAILERIADIFETTVIEPSAMPAAFASQNNIIWHQTNASLDPTFAPDLALLAIKPQYMPEVLPAYAHYKNCVFVSIAAGITLARLINLLGGDRTPVIRIMPNLPASIGAGMSVAIANTAVTDDQRRLCDQILKKIGAAAWLDDESLMDAVTALSGSGPAYVFALCETMTKAGEALGLPRSLAAQLARQTVIGSGELLRHAPDDAATLRAAVTSPKGTTEAALKLLMAPDGLQPLIDRTMAAAASRSKELAQ